MSRRGWLGLLAGCLAALVLIPTGWALMRADNTGVGQLPSAGGPTSPATTPASTAPAREGPAAGAAAVPTYQADLAARDGSATQALTPTVLTIAAIAVSAPVEPVGVASDGMVAIPPDAHHVGWYEFGPAPGDAAGSAVIVGHRDSRTQGRGALYDLGAVSLGDKVQVRLSSGKTLTYRVVERRRYPKQGLPWATFFTDRGPPRLTVITCGGPYDPRHGGYQDNLIVTATPI